MFGVSDSGYYAWKARQLDKDGKQAAKRRERNDIKEKMRQIVIARNGVIPGKRTFRAELFRRYGLTVNVKRIAALMKEMHLVAQRPHKDAYKHQASHNHVCAAPANEVDQDFFIGPRRVILTDITYLYYGPCRDTFYLCVFRDAYTRENLGWDIGLNMTVGLVKNAYGRMLGEHGDELNRNASVYVHHDQGSQYLSTTFKELLEDDGFIQSVSARGNSQDNAPMESFFGRLKTAILDMVARCRTFDDAKELVSGYIKAYNTEHYQYDLAALTPAEFYQYATTGIYPLDNYFGVPASVMMTNGDLKKVRRRYADDEAKKRRETAARKREGKRLIDPLRIINRDQKLLDRFIRKWEESKETATTQIAHLREIVEKVRKALDFIAALPSEKYEELKDPLIWRNYEQLGYVFEMNELF
jgi:transposase InsO family protein